MQHSAHNELLYLTQFVFWPSYLPKSSSPFQIWNEMTELVSSSNNYSCYRKAFSECQGFKIPILGVHLKDLIAVHVVFPDRVDDSNKVNLVKMNQLYMTFNELMSLQSAAAQVEPNMDLIYLLTVREYHPTEGNCRNLNGNAGLK